MSNDLKTDNEVKNTDVETFSFSADINQLLSLIINTFYSNKDIVIRELISNASDALNKIRYESLTDSSVLGEEEDLKISISFDKENKVIAISDTGIGMSKDDLINNLGTIAKSGTKAFIEQIQSSNDISMIGQFGVGFYSAYLIANKVEVISKKNNSDTYCWVSEAGGSFSVMKIEESPIKRGTIINLHLKEDMTNYLESGTIKDIIKKHSQYIEYPIYLQVEKTRTVEVAEDEEVIETKEEEDGVKLEELDEQKEESKTPKTIEEKYIEMDVVNSDKPIWTRSPKDVTQEEYVQFYKSFSNAYEEHLDVLHFHVEGSIEYRAILYVPKRAPNDLFESATSKKKSSIKLYVRRVFISDTCEELIPEYLRFVTGIVDSDDMPLNISREMLQQNKILRIISKNLVKKCLELFSNISEDKEKYKVFYENFSKNIKLGIHEDANNRTKLANLLRFESTKSNNDIISLQEYVNRMKEGQKGIYFITGESKNVIQNTPFLEKLVSLDYEVLYMTDPIDEYMTQQLKEFDGKKMINITKEKLDLGDIDKELIEKQQTEFKDLCEKIKEILGNEVENVVISNRLSNSPCVLVTNEWGMSANMQRIMKAQALRNNQDMSYMMGRKSMEINPNNKIMINLNEQVKEKESMNIKLVRDLVWLMYEVALINSGFTLDNPRDFSNRIHSLIAIGLSIDDTNTDTGTDNNEVSTEETTTDSADESTMEHVD
jgi:molecular chaperone HtpG